MPHVLNKLTAKQVEKLTKPGLYSDGGGLYLQISKAGVKSWLQRFMIEGKAYGMGLGPTHTVTLAEARQKSAEARKQLLNGINPLELKKQRQQQLQLDEAKAMTFAQCAKAYHNAQMASWKSEKHAKQWLVTVINHACPTIGHLPVSEIDIALVVKPKKLACHTTGKQGNVPTPYLTRLCSHNRHGFSWFCMSTCFTSFMVLTKLF